MRASKLLTIIFLFSISAYLLGFFTGFMSVVAAISGLAAAVVLSFEK